MGHKDEPISRMSMPNRGAQVNTPQFMGWQEGLDMAQVQKIIKRQKVKICLVSPELVKKSRLNEIKKIFSFLRKNKIIIDAVCTKKPELWLKF